jgi:hypothetical protein
MGHGDFLLLHFLPRGEAGAGGKSGDCGGQVVLVA